MRKRSEASLYQKQLAVQQFPIQLRKSQRQLQLIKNQYQMIQKQRDILRQGQMNIISQFVFNKGSQDTSKLSASLEQSHQQNRQLREKLLKLQEIVKRQNCDKQHLDNTSERILPIKSTISIFENNRKSDRQQLKMEKQQLLSDDLIRKMEELKRNYQSQKLRNTQLQQYNLNLGQQIQALKTDLQQINIQITAGAPPQAQLQKSNEQLAKKQVQINSKARELVALGETLKLKNNAIQDHKKQNGKLKDILKLKDQQWEAKQHELQSKLDETKQKYHRQTKQLVAVKQRRNFNYSSATIKPPRVNILTDSSIKLCSSMMCQPQDNHNNDMVKSFISESVASQSDKLESIAFEFGKSQRKLTKLQKINLSLEKDYKHSQDKIKTANREYSKLKLDYLKSAQDYRKKQQAHLKKIQSSQLKIQNLMQVIGQLQNRQPQIKPEVQLQKSTLKHIIMQSQAQVQKLYIQISSLKKQNRKLNETIQQSKNSQSNLPNYRNQLQIERNKTSRLQRQFELKSKQWQSKLKGYEQMVQEWRGIYNIDNKDEKKKSGIGALQTGRCAPKSYGQSLHLQHQPIIRALNEQVRLLKQNLINQNLRYNILQNSNKQLRKQLLKMIEQQQKLRKDLINQKIKSRTKSRSLRGSQQNSNSNGRSLSKLRRDSHQQLREGNNKVENNLTATTSNANFNIKLTRDNNNSQRKIVNTDRRNTQTQLNRLTPSSSLSKYQAQKQNIQNKYLDNAKNQNSYLKNLREKRFNNNNNKINNSQNNQSVSNDKYVHKLKEAIIKCVNEQSSGNRSNLIPDLQMANNFTHEKDQQNDNRQFTLQISSSKSNLSRRDHINQLTQIYHPTDKLKCYQQNYQKIPVQPRSASKFNMYINNKQQCKQLQFNCNDRANGILFTKDQQTKSHAQVRFARKNKFEDFSERKGPID